VILLAGLAAYHGSLDGPFIFDDLESIIHNPSIRQLGDPAAMLTPPDGGRTVHGRPILNVSLALNYAIGGTGVFGYHALNLLIHLLAAVILFGLVRRTLELPSISKRFPAPSPHVLATITACVWVVHPLTTSAVTYVIQRAESLAGLLSLLTLYCVLRGATGPRSGTWYSAAVIACALGIGCKETVAVVPLVVLLYDTVYLSETMIAALGRRWRLYAGLAASWVLLAVLVSQAAGRGGSAGFGHGITAWQYAARQTRAIFEYLSLSVWPRNLILDYGTDVPAGFASVAVFAAGVAVLLALAGAAMYLRPAAGFLCVSFFLLLAPSSSVIPVVTQTAAEHRMYLPLAVLVAGAVIGVHAVLARLPPAGREIGRSLPAVMVLLACAAVAGLAWRTWVRNEDYRTEAAIWRDTVAKRPGNARARGALCLYLMRDGNYDDAEREIKEAIRLDPGNAEFHLHRANLLDMTGRPDDALAAYDRALELDPGYAEAYDNRGITRFRLGQSERALEDFDAAISLRPDSVPTYLNRAVCYTAIGQYDRAWDDVRTLARLGGSPPPEFLARLRSLSGTPPR